MTMEEHSGKTAYKAYCAYSGGKSLVSDCDLPEWEQLRHDIKMAWIAAALSVAEL